MLDFCVAIRAYNAERYLPEILDALFSQKNLEDTQWEVLIVDNCSTDRTAEIVREYEAKWLTNVPLRYCFEPRQGSSYARRRAIEEANAPLIGFLDDDNIPSQNWISSALHFASTHPNAGAFGGQIHPEFEASPPENFGRIAVFFAIVERKKTVCFTTGKYDKLNMLPPGAGIIIRRQIWLDNVPRELSLNGPVGKSLARKGEDIEALTHIKQAGWEVWFNADMHICHKIPQARFEKDYLMRFFKGIGLSKVHIRRGFTSSHLKWYIKLILYALNDFRKTFIYLIRHNFKIQRDLVYACEFQLLWYTFLSSLNWLLGSPIV